ncbi:2-dehydropantoate 2-reductase [Paenibacillus rhizosphaerae]|uniref:2-dehydropantoate 2-reductase n=1 Tax=Paenibacillus rhizosphaerae TaxID=297318 RepID=A0A839TKN2_9BACL|nr:ketopantoate reductase family protein [Paenibacillus rhizosphaerae]MBB3127345.1 2-dehydropantoate 2-reductase [Paenibacillus rhizosphaerae]
MLIDIVGAGSLGLLFGGKLARSGSRVRIWSRSAGQAEQLRHTGIHIAKDGDRRLKVDPAKFQSGTIEQLGQTWETKPGDYVLVMTKQKDTEAVCRYLSQIRLPQGHSRPVLVCFQNGYGHMDRLEAILPEWDMLAAVTTEGAKRTSYTEVLHAGSGDTWIGESGTGHVRKEAGSRWLNLVQALKQAGFYPVLSNDIDNMIFRKLLINAVINPLTALWRIPNGELLGSPARMKLMKELYEETIAVYDACGIQYEDDMWDQILKVCRATSGNTSSMLKDVLAGTPTEIGWINGSIVDMALKAGVLAPVNELVTRLIEGLIAEEE